MAKDLLRVIRNKSHHHRDLAPEVRAALGELPGTCARKESYILPSHSILSGPFLSYFTSRFPNLLIETYKHLKKYCQKEEVFQQYFASVVEE